jgi:hypothetical protein
MAEQTVSTLPATISSDQQKSLMLEALKATLGIVTKAADKARIAPSLHYEWFYADDKYRKAVEEINSRALDEVEGKLYELIGHGNITAIIFYLKTKGRKRGYAEKAEPTEEERRIGYKIIVDSKEQAELYERV